MVQNITRNHKLMRKKNQKLDVIYNRPNIVSKKLVADVQIMKDISVNKINKRKTSIKKTKDPTRGFYSSRHQKRRLLTIHMMERNREVL